MIGVSEDAGATETESDQSKDFLKDSIWIKFDIGKRAMYTHEKSLFVKVYGKKEVDRTKGCAGRTGTAFKIWSV